MRAADRVRLGCAVALVQACAGDPLGTRMTESALRTNDVGDASVQAAVDGCRLEAKPPSGRLAMEVSGIAREYELVLPRGYDGSKRFAVLFAWHGTSSSGEEFIESYFGYGAIVDGVADRALIVAPDGLVEDEGEYAGRTRWQLDESDGILFDRLLDHLSHAYCIDPERVFSTGHSIGAYFTNYLGCTRGDRLRAIAPVAGGGPLETEACVGHPAVVVGHNPAECAVETPGKCQFAVPWAETGWLSAKFWAARNGCDDPKPMPESAYSGDPPCRALSGCDPRAPVSLCLYDYENWFAGPHAWPTPWLARTIMDAFLRLPGE
jgi:polyhydroxybutyrate depolymerase